MIRLESVVVAVLGGVLGTVLGVVFGATMVTALEDEGLTDLAVPWAAARRLPAPGGRRRACSRPWSRHAVRPGSMCCKAIGTE